MNRSLRRYTVEFGGALLAYALVLALSMMLLRSMEDSTWRIPVALAPVLPALFVALSALRGIARLDELQRRIQLEALAFAFGGTAILTFSYGFLQKVGFPNLSWLLVWPLMAVLWALGKLVASRRYR